MTFEEKFEALMKNFQAMTSTDEELKHLNEYLWKQLDENMKQEQKAFESPTGSIHGDEEASNLIISSGEDEPPRRTRGVRTTPSNSNDFEYKIPKFKGKLDFDEFLDWLHTVERAFDYKDILEHKDVKLVAHALRKYVSLVDESLC